MLQHPLIPDVDIGLKRRQIDSDIGLAVRINSPLQTAKAVHLANFVFLDRAIGQTRGVAIQRPCLSACDACKGEGGGAGEDCKYSCHMFFPPKLSGNEPSQKRLM